MTDRERAKELADEIELLAASGHDTWVREKEAPIFVAALRAYAAPAASTDLRAAAAAFFDKHPSIMDTMQAFVHAWEETEDPHENIRRKREAWRNAFLSCIDPLLITTGLGGTRGAPPRAVSADLRETVLTAVGWFGRRRNSATDEEIADAALTAISAAGYVLMPPEDETKWTATPAERLMIYKLIEWGSSPDDAGPTVGGLSKALAAGGFVIVPREPTEAMIEAALYAWFTDPQWREAFSGHPCRDFMRRAIRVATATEPGE